MIVVCDTGPARGRSGQRRASDAEVRDYFECALPDDAVAGSPAVAEPAPEVVPAWPLLPGVVAAVVDAGRPDGGEAGFGADALRDAACLADPCRGVPEDFAAPPAPADADDREWVAPWGARCVARLAARWPVEVVVRWVVAVVPPWWP